MIHTWNIPTETANGVVDVGSLGAEITAAGYAFARIGQSGNTLEIDTEEAKVNLDPIVSAHAGDALPPTPQEVTILDKDGDTGAVKVTNSFAPDGFYQRLHEVEFTTSRVGGAIHDKNINNEDNGWSSVAHYELVGNVETLMVSPTQNDLDTKCVRTDFRFMPNVDYMIKSGTIAHDAIPASEVYVWGKIVDTEPALWGSGIMPITVLDGGLAMTFVGVRTPVGLKGVNGSLLFYDGVNTPGGKVTTPAGLGTNRITFVCRHDVGFQHRFQSIFEIFRAP